MNLIVLAIPAFFVLIGVELAVGLARGRRLYRGADTATCLSLGTLQVAFGVVAAGALTGLYHLAWDHRLLTLPTREPLVIIISFLAVDFCYYWFHRVGHRSMIAWASHAPHHSSEDYNLAVALRQGPVQPIVSRFFYLPLAFFGLDFETFVLLSSINTLYQFWIHTELVGRLGPLEWVLNTPSHHRVHHGCNGRALDKNHGGTLIVWDRLFGTFADERDVLPLVYGTVTPARSWNPLGVAWIPFGELVRKVRAAGSFPDVLRAVVAPPEWLPAGLVASAPVTGPREKYERAISRGRAAWVSAHFVVVLGASVGFFVAAASLPGAAVAAVSLWLAWSFGSLGAVLDDSRFAGASEVARFAVGVPFVVGVLRSTGVL
jgi:sterol desaturase/sphingolipid hydroxylase (fatty acid hydroxylase superfamily)